MKINSQDSSIHYASLVNNAFDSYIPCREPETDDDSNKKAKVTMVSWDVSDEFVVTAVNDYSLKVWNAKSGELMKVLRGHKDEVFVLESHPIDPRVILSAGHDGQLIIWDVLNTEPMACFQNFIEGQGNCAVFDAKWSPDGTMLAATDSNGHLLMYGFGSGVEKLKIVSRALQLYLLVCIICLFYSFSQGKILQSNTYRPSIFIHPLKINSNVYI